MRQRRRPRRSAILIAAGLCLTLPACTAEPAAPVSTESAPDPLAAVFGAAVEEADVPGGAIAVRRDGETRVVPVGVADEAGATVTEDTLFAYRSVTKSLVTTVVLQLADEGVIDLDSPVPTAGTGVDGDASVSDLATMTSGIPNYSAQPGLGGLLTAQWDRSWTDTTLYALIDGVPASFAPGSSYQYSNTNTVLLGQLISVRSGRGWDEAVAERLTDPYEMDSVVYPGDRLPPPGTATGFQIDEDGTAEALPPVRASAFSAAGGMFGTAADLATWAEILGTGAAVSADAHRLRTEALAPTDADPASPEYDAYGFGIGRLDRWIGHTGSGLGFQSLAMYHGDTGTAVAIVVNGTGPDSDLPARILQDLEEEILQER